jgi:hypothetical protein
MPRPVQPRVTEPPSWLLWCGAYRGDATGTAAIEPPSCKCVTVSCSPLGTRGTLAIIHGPWPPIMGPGIGLVAVCTMAIRRLPPAELFAEMRVRPATARGGGFHGATGAKTEAKANEA